MIDPNQTPFTAKSFTKFLHESKLMSVRCLECGIQNIPPRAICPSCHSETLEWVTLSGIGKIAAFTSIYIGPTFMNELGFDRKNPYLTGIVELMEGVKISARLVGYDAAKPEEISIGTPVEVEFIPIARGEGTTVQLAFRPIGLD